MKRFYKEVSILASPLEGEADFSRAKASEKSVGGDVDPSNTPPRNSLREFRPSLKGRVEFFVLLDGKPVKTSARAALALPSRALAEAVAEEWRAQGDDVRPQAMPLYRLSCGAIDGFAAGRGRAEEEILAYANDLLCYRATAPAELVKRQNAQWDPLLAWAAERYAPLNTGGGVMHIEQTAEALAAYRRALQAEDVFILAALSAAVKICGSLVLALALRQGRLAAEEAFALSRLDETFQAETWGRDEEAESRADALLAELAAAERFMRLARE